MNTKSVWDDEEEWCASGRELRRSGRMEDVRKRKKELNTQCCSAIPDHYGIDVLKKESLGGNGDVSASKRGLTSSGGLVMQNIRKIMEGTLHTACN